MRGPLVFPQLQGKSVPCLHVSVPAGRPLPASLSPELVLSPFLPVCSPSWEAAMQSHLGSVLWVLISVQHFLGNQGLSHLVLTGAVVQLTKAVTNLTGTQLPRDGPQQLVSERSWWRGTSCHLFWLILCAHLGGPQTHVFGRKLV